MDVKVSCASYVSRADRRVASPVSTSELESQLDSIARSHPKADDWAVVMNRRNGQLRAVPESALSGSQSGAVLPLRLAPLRATLHGMEGWLQDRNPIFYVDANKQAHIDFMSLAGFIVDPMGHILSRSVTPD